MKNFINLSVIGSGSWGSAIACHLARIYEKVRIYTDSQIVMEEINNYNLNSKYLGNIPLPDNLIATDKINNIIDSDVIFIAVPSYAFGDILKELKNYKISSNTIFVIATKGISSDPVELLSEKFKKEFSLSFAFFSGPNFAKEVAVGKFTSATISSEDLNLANSLAKDLSTSYFEISTVADIITVQIASIVKNIVAIKSGILEASGSGANEKAWVVTKALQEISQISQVMGGKYDSLLEPAVVGDLILTSCSQVSRNTKFGFQLHKNNYSQKFISSYPLLVEGLEAARLIQPLMKRHGIKMLDLPIINSVVSLLCTS